MHWVNYLFLYNGSNTIKCKKYRGKLVKNLMKNSPFLSQSEVKKIKIICSNQCKTNNNHLIYTHLKFVNPTISSILTALGVADSILECCMTYSRRNRYKPNINNSYILTISCPH